MHPRDLCKFFPWSQEVIISYLKKYKLYFKICTGRTCKNENNPYGMIKHMDSFPKCSALKDGLKSWCRKCNNEYYTNDYYVVHGDEVRQHHLDEWHNNKDHVRQRNNNWKTKPEAQLHIRNYNLEWNANNTDHIREYNKKYRKNHPGRSNSDCAKRRARKLQATPSWVNSQELDQIYAKSIKLTGSTNIGHEVHHIFPLTENKHFCGLHVPWNLEILSIDEHRGKHKDRRNYIVKYHFDNGILIETSRIIM